MQIRSSKVIMGSAHWFSEAFESSRKETLGLLFRLTGAKGWGCHGSRDLPSLSPTNDVPSHHYLQPSEWYLPWPRRSPGSPESAAEAHLGLFIPHVSHHAVAQTGHQAEGTPQSRTVPKTPTPVQHLPDNFFPESWFPASE